ncbi:MAG: hypothetical protein HUU31_26360 [Anaerolineae bacterium]|nr:hypothetical protein [Anaerolineae bacterium]
MRSVMGAAAAGALAALLIVSDGIAISWDGEAYLAAARAIREMGGIPRDWAAFPPLYPILLAAAPPATMLTWAAALNVLALAGVAGMAAALMPARRGLIVAVVVGGTALRFVQGWVLAEPIFALLIMLFAVGVQRRSGAAAGDPGVRTRSGAASGFVDGAQPGDGRRADGRPRGGGNVAGYERPGGAGHADRLAAAADRGMAGRAFGDADAGGASGAGGVLHGTCGAGGVGGSDDESGHAWGPAAVAGLRAGGADGGGQQTSPPAPLSGGEGEKKLYSAKSGEG